MVPRLTVRAAAAAACVHKITLYRALEGKELHGEQRAKGGRWTIRPECLDAWLDNEKCEHQIAAAAVTNLADRRAAREARTSA
ncbi:helix-turn-helix domain-containing protein [Promicromonospora sp. NPDC023805]|uniref:helix-turn-helix domain-containing protein n=1 Tax=Promicromonospora sp. NPDC023805 TaxID=3154696 RepID=UPI0033CF6A02